MRQSLIAGLIFLVIGLMMLVAPYKVWEITEKWKYENAAQPSKNYIIFTRIISVVFIVCGVLFTAGIIA